ncbi:glycosyltransferase family 39 protein [Gaiella sp.]|uniref:glycosyltransferase family 39 protein n=1 Tax=Gaiella sp. TaxID=2663207 RepID=UPI003266AB3C
MTEHADSTAHSPSASVAARAFVTAHAFWLTVGAISLAAGAFLVHQLMAWPPHEDETLALFVGRDSLPGVIEHVTRERGGAPLHFLFAWAVAHLGFGLGGMRLVSAAFAVASVPLVALLGRRLADRRSSLIATALVAGSWVFLFHGVYARMYSLFLFLSLLSFLLLLRALDRRDWGAWAAWGAALLLGVAAHPYGALVFASQAAFILVARRDQIRRALVAFVVVGLAGIPFWITDLVLANRFDVGVGGRGSKLGGPWAIVTYLWQTAGDFTTGRWPVLAIVLIVGLVGLVVVRFETRSLALCVIGVPVAAFLAARLGGSTSPESRHLIFVLPFFAIVVGVGLLRVTRRVPVATVALTAVLVVLEVGWAWNRTPQLFEWEPNKRQATRAQAEAFLAATSRSDDILFGYEPLYLGAWERNGDFPDVVVPRADSALALRTVRRQPKPLGRGVWVLDASERNNLKPRLEIDDRDPGPTGTFETRAFGPFLVIRTIQPVVDDRAYFAAAARAMLVGRSLGIGDADVNLQTIERADRVLRGYGPSLRLLADNSR